MAQVPEWTAGEEVAKGGLRTQTQSGRVDVYVAVQDVSGFNVWLDPASSPTYWLELDNYNGSYVAGIRYPKGHIVDHVVAGQTLWYIASDDTAQEPPGAGWLLFGGARVPPVPAAALLPTRWRAPITIVRSQCVATGIDLDDLPDTGQSLFRVEPPAGADTVEQEALLFTTAIKALPPVAVGDNLLTAGTNKSIMLSDAPSITDRALVARTADGGLCLQIPDNVRYPLGQAARFTFAHERAWPILFFDAVAGDVGFTAAADGELVGTLAPTVRSRLAPTPTPDTRGQYVRQSPDGETYELTVEAPYTALPVYATPDDYRARIGGTRSLTDDDLEPALDAAARLIDQQLEVVPGYFAPTDEATYLFTGRGGRTLDLRDDDGLAYALRSVADDGIRPDYDFTGAHDQYGWDLDDAFIWPLARNALQHGRPYHALQLRRVASAPITVWPSIDGSVQITGAWGWTTTPGPIRELTVKLAKDMRDSERGGAAGRVQDLDDPIAYSTDTWRLWLDIKSEFGRRRARVGQRMR